MTMQTSPIRQLNWWNLSLWTVQILLGLLYLWAGFAKITQPIEALIAGGMGFVTSFPEWFTRVIGALEVLGGAGLILPAATRIRPWLTLLAAAGLALVQVGAIITHAFRGELAAALPINLVLLALALFIVWGRLQKARILPR